jgi:hypothetical protein
MLPSGGLVTAVSGGKVADAVGALVHEAARIVISNAMVRYFISTPHIDCLKDALCCDIVPQQKKAGAGPAFCLIS